jgi:hypothetical protein
LLIYQLQFIWDQSCGEKTINGHELRSYVIEGEIKMTNRGALEIRRVGGREKIMNCDKFRLRNVDRSERIINGDNLTLHSVQGGEGIVHGDKLRFFIPVSR